MPIDGQGDATDFDESNRLYNRIQETPNLSDLSADSQILLAAIRQTHDAIEEQSEKNARSLRHLQGEASRIETRCEEIESRMEAHIASRNANWEELDERLKNLEGTLHTMRTTVPDAHRVTDNWLRDIDPAVVRIKTHQGLAVNLWEVKDVFASYLKSLGLGKNPQEPEYVFDNAMPGNRIFNLRFRGSHELAMARRNQFLQGRLNKETNKWWDFTVHGTKGRKIPLYTSIDQN